MKFNTKLLDPKVLVQYNVVLFHEAQSIEASNSLAILMVEDYQSLDFV